MVIKEEVKEETMRQQEEGEGGPKANETSKSHTTRFKVRGPSHGTRKN